MKAQITKRQKLANLPSASDVEIINGIIYLAGDDSPYLYCLDQHWNLVRTITLFETDQFATGRIPKQFKPDFEAMTEVMVDGRQQLLIFGSGSRSPQRDVCYRVQISDALRQADVPVQKTSLVALYDSLRGREAIVGHGKLNIEGGAATRDHLILFQRGNISGNNVALYFELPSFMAYLEDLARPVPTAQIYRYELPRINGILSGFSGACTTPRDERIVFSAAVEDTTSELEDGETLGSFLGLLPVEREAQPGRDAARPLASALTLDADGQRYIGKIESVAVLEQHTPDQFTILAASDDDRGGSDLLLIEIEVAQSQT